MLSNFFRINLPYGIKRDNQGNWIAFNREYKPLGFYTGSIFNESVLPLAVKYPKLSQDLLFVLSGENEKMISRDEKGEIVKVWFYDDSTNPTNHRSNAESLWENYFSKLKYISNIESKGDLYDFRIPATCDFGWSQS